MDEHASGDAGDFVELGVTNTLPCIGKILAVLEAAILFADGADAPLAVGLGGFREEDIEDLGCDTLRNGVLLLEGVQMIGPWHALGENEDAALGVVLKARVVRLLHVVACRQPPVGAVGELQEELLAHEFGRLCEALVFGLLLLFLAQVGIGVLAGSVIEPADHARDAEAAVLELLGEPRGFQILWRNDIHTVVVGVECLDEVGVDLLVEQIEIGTRLQSGDLGDDGFAEVHVDEAGGRELGVVAGEDGRELALVVVVALLLVAVDSAHVDDGVARLEDVGVARADEGRVFVGGEQTEHGDGEGLVGVEVAAVGADQRRVDVHLHLLGGVLGGHGAGLEGAREEDGGQWRRSWGRSKGPDGDAGVEGSSESGGVEVGKARE